MRQVKWCLLLLAAISPGCQPEAATARRQAATNDRGADEAAAPGLAGTADRLVAAGQAEAAPVARPAEGTGSRAQGGASGGGPPGNGASAPVAEPAAAGEGQDGKAAAPGLAGDEVKKDAIQTADDAAAALLLLDDEPLALADDSGESPAAALRSRLLDAQRKPGVFGRRAGLLEFVRCQIAMQAKKRLSGRR